MAAGRNVKKLGAGINKKWDKEKVKDIRAERTEENKGNKNNLLQGAVIFVKIISNKSPQDTLSRNVGNKILSGAALHPGRSKTSTKTWLKPKISQEIQRLSCRESNLVSSDPQHPRTICERLRKKKQNRI
jgi:hypothetical protein